MFFFCLFVFDDSPKRSLSFFEFFVTFFPIIVVVVFILLAFQNSLCVCFISSFPRIRCWCFRRESRCLFRCPKITSSTILLRFLLEEKKDISLSFIGRTLGCQLQSVGGAFGKSPPCVVRQRPMLRRTSTSHASALSPWTTLSLIRSHCSTVMYIYNICTIRDEGMMAILYLWGQRWQREMNARKWMAKIEEGERKQTNKKALGVIFLLSGVHARASSLM